MLLMMIFDALDDDDEDDVFSVGYSKQLLLQTKYTQGPNIFYMLTSITRTPHSAHSIITQCVNNGLQNDIPRPK